MNHQSGRYKLNMKGSHRIAVLRNQVIQLIVHGCLTSPKPRIKQTQKLAERVVTIAREGNTFNARRRVQALLPYNSKAVIRLFQEIAPKYADRNGGYTRVVSLGRRASDTAPVARLEWV
jgi:large subunit ribosomal protein L17